MSVSNEKKLKVAILGYGGRGKFYSEICKSIGFNDKYDVVAVIENSKEKRDIAKAKLKLTDDMIFSNLDDFCQQPTMADYLFVCTQDKQHYEHSIKALNAGYNLMLEKPIACSIEDCVSIAETAEKLNLKINVCHVLRYSSYYGKIKEIIDSGVLGRVIAIEQIENVSYWHYAHSYIRGDWRRKDESTPMILAKCCHDLDIAVFLADSQCEYVSSIGKLNYFKKENAPVGATEFCLNGCKAKDACPYDCEKLYISKIKKLPNKIIENLWPQSRLMPDGKVTIPKLYEQCKSSRYGKCVYLSDNDVVDYQTTTMVFENGITSTLIMTAFGGKECYRQTRIRGSLGEIIADTTNSKLSLEIYGQKIKKIRIDSASKGSHGGGDQKMIKALASGEMKSDIKKSIESHLIGFCAEESRLNNGMPIYIDKYRVSKDKITNQKVTIEGDKNTAITIQAIEDLAINGIEAHTMPLKGNQFVWYKIVKDGDKIFIKNAEKNSPASNLKKALRLDLSELDTIYDIYKRRCKGEMVAVEATKATRMKAYWYGIFAYLENKY